MALGGVTGAVVLELGEGVAVSYAASLFRGYGARVIKAERPAGDTLRRLPPFFTAPDGRRVGAHFHHLCRGKESVVAGNSAAGDDILRDLAAAADVVLHDVDSDAFPAPAGLVPGDERRRVYVELSRFGKGGPYSSYAGSDLVLFASCGRMSWHGNAGEGPLQYLPDIASFQHGLTVAAVASAYLLPGPPGTHRVEVAGMEALAGNTDSLVTVASFTGQVNPRGLHPSSAVPCKDGYVHISSMRQEYMVRLCQLMGRPDIPELPQFKQSGGFQRHRDDFLVDLIPWCLERTMVELVDLLQGNKIMCSPVFTIADAVTHPQYAGFLRREPTGDGRTLTLPGAPFETAGLPWTQHARAPFAGEHTDGVLTGLLGYPQERVDDLRAAGVVA